MTESSGGDHHAVPQLDQLPVDAVIGLLLDAEARVVPTLRHAAVELAAASAIVGAAVRAGGRLIFTGAGTSGRLAAAEAAELPGTFGIDAGRCRSVVAGGGAVIDDSAEDDAAAGTAAMRALEVGPGDVVIAVTASGRTPFTLAAATAARAAGAAVVAIVNATASPLAECAGVTVTAVVGEEVLRGSTRLTAGTAQKIALNTLTTAAMAGAGRIHGEFMIDMVAANAKLRERQAAIVAAIAGRSPAEAAAALATCGGNARAAVLHLVRGLAPETAATAAAAAPSLRAALDATS